MATFFVSDTHFNHKNIIKYSQRPFKDIEEMNDRMYKNWAAVVGPDDTVYHFGDFSFGQKEQVQTSLKIVGSLPGKKKLILGNHDAWLTKERGGDALKYFETIRDLQMIKVEDKEAQGGVQRIVLCHYSLRVWDGSHHGVWNLYGHSHGTLEDPLNLMSMDCGVDATARWMNNYPIGGKTKPEWKFQPQDYRPISYDEVKARMKLKTWKPVDHHGDDGDGRY